MIYIIFQAIQSVVIKKTLQGITFNLRRGTD